VIDFAAVPKPLRAGYHLRQRTLRSKAVAFDGLALPCGFVTGSCVCGGGDMSVCVWGLGFDLEYKFGDRIFSNPCNTS
jgi:hypothetical protein